MLLAQALLTTLAVYLSAGLLFAIAFLSKGLPTIDAAASESGIAFRILILPGCIALWPLLLSRWMRA